MGFVENQTILPHSPGEAVGPWVVGAGAAVVVGASVVVGAGASVVVGAGASVVVPPLLGSRHSHTVQ
jgi:hypothetical protein